MDCVTSYCPKTCRTSECLDCSDALGTFILNEKEPLCNYAYIPQFLWLCKTSTMYEKIPPRACGVCVPECVDSAAQFKFGSSTQTCATIPKWGCSQDWIKELCVATCTKCSTEAPFISPSNFPSSAPSQSPKAYSSPSWEPTRSPLISTTKLISHQVCS